MDLTREQREKEALGRVKEAREHLLQDDPLYGLVALQRSLRICWHTTLTAATDGKEVVWNPAFVETLKDGDIQTLFRHEFWHILKGDHLRVSEQYKRCPEIPKSTVFKLFNIAADLVINTTILRYGEGRTLPEGCLYDCTVRGKDTEEVFDDLLKEMKEKTEEQQGKQKAEEGSPDNTLPGDEDVGAGEEGAEGEGEGEEGEGAEGEGEGEGSSQAEESPIDEKLVDEMAKESKGIDVQEPKNEDGSEMTDTEKKEAREEAFREVRQALMCASKTGKVSGETKVMIDKEMKPTKTAHEVLTRFLQDAISKSDYSFRKPNKRYLDTGFYLPTLQEESFSRICAIIDVSGSVSDGMVKDFCAEMREYLEGIGSDAELLVLYVDTQVTGHEVLKKEDSFDLNPRRVTGGTRFEPGFKWLYDNQEGDRLNGVVYYTDGHCSSFPSMEIEPPCPVMWVLHHEKHAPLESFRERVPFGEVIIMPKKGGK